MEKIAVEKKHPWYEWIPGWLPVCTTIVMAALWVGQYTQSINDRLQHLENSVHEIRQYIQAHDKNSAISGDAQLTHSVAVW